MCLFVYQSNLLPYHSPISFSQSSTGSTVSPPPKVAVLPLAGLIIHFGYISKTPSHTHRLIQNWLARKSICQQPAPLLCSTLSTAQKYSHLISINNCWAIFFYSRPMSEIIILEYIIYRHTFLRYQITQASFDYSSVLLQFKLCRSLIIISIIIKLIIIIILQEFS